jgi:hypothetical protein
MFDWLIILGVSVTLKSVSGGYEAWFGFGNMCLFWFRGLELLRNSFFNILEYSLPQQNIYFGE